MRKIKIFIISLIVLILTGCTGSYNLTINEDFSITEDVNIRISNNNNNYEKVIELFKNYGLDEKDFSINIVDDNIKVTYKKDYSSIESYILESKLYSYLFDYINYNSENKTMDFYTKGYFKLDSSYSEDSNIVNSLDIELININISTPYNIINTNSDSITDDTMTWNIKRDTHDKTISFKIDIDNKSFNKSYSILLIIIIVAVLVSVGYILKRIIKGRKK